MTQIQLQKFIAYLQKQKYSVFGPFEEDGIIKIKSISNPKKFKLLGKLSFYSFKKFFLPPKEILFNFKKNHLIKNKEIIKKQALFGLSVFDLSALMLYNNVFEKDFFYQERRKNILVIGQSIMLSDEKFFQNWEEKYEEDVLEHLRFDIFLGIINHPMSLSQICQPFLKQKQIELKSQKIKYKVFTGSIIGQKILDEFGFKDYEHVQFAGSIKEEGINLEMIKIKEAMQKNYKAEIWKELGKKCIECGKCSLVCPTCFCFDIKDEMVLGENKGQREQCWASCFYQEFSEIANAYKFLNTTAKRIYNWYYHKFVRIPEEYSFSGCVGCGRCIKVCPAGIDIREVLKKIKSKNAKCKINKFKTQNTKQKNKKIQE
ncbi:MAG: 4Fe-4S dicluster domain-containing protein [Candidatus Kuenenbacteria bacterium]